LAVGALALGLSVGPLAAPAAPAGGPFAGMSAQKVLSVSIAAAVAERSVACTTTDRVSSSRTLVKATTILGRSSGEERATGTYEGRSVQATLIVVGDRVYVDGNKAGLEAPMLVGMLAATAAKYAGRWFYGPISNEPFDILAADLTLAKNAFDGILLAPYSLGREVEVDGQEVVGVHGRLGTGAEGKDTSGWLFVAVSGTHLPVRYDATATSGKTVYGYQTDFSHWNAAVRVQPPKGAVAYS